MAFRSPKVDSLRHVRVRRGVEFVVLFFGAVGGYALLGSPGSPIPVLLVLGGLAFWYLRRHTDAPLWGALELRPILLTWAVAAVVGIAVVAIFRPGDLFDLPREAPWLWLAGAVVY